MFRDELLAVIEQIERTPTIGVLFATVDDVRIYRVLMQRSRYHVYYSIAGDDVVVASIWSAQRKRAPDLGRR